MAKNAFHDGRVLDHVLAATATSGTPIAKGSLVGVPITDGAIGDTIALHVTGVWELPKLSTAVITDGMRLTWDVSAGEVIIASAAVGDIENFGVAIAAAGNGTTTVKVLLCPGAGTVKAS